MSMLPNRRRRYGYRKPQPPSLLYRIMAIVVLAAGALYGLGTVAARFDWDGTVSTKAEASPVDLLAKAQSHLDSGDQPSARAALAPLLEAGSTAPGAARALYLAARIESDAGRPEAASPLLRRLIEEHPAAPETPHAMARLAALREAQGDAAAAHELYSKLVRQAPPELRAEAHLGLGRLALAQDVTRDAVEHLEHAAARASWGSQVWGAAVDHLGALRVEQIFSPVATPDSRTYVVEPGDTLTAIGVKLNTTQGLLIRANGIDDPRDLRVGQKLKYTPKDFRIVIALEGCMLYLYDNNGLFKRYPVGLGMPGYETTPGKYSIGNKQKDPTWFKPGSEPIPPGDPRNELGTRWMPLVPVEAALPEDLGIHGTIEPESIGDFTSHGCARMLPADVEELYDLVVRGTPVTIVPAHQPNVADA